MKEVIYRKAYEIAVMNDDTPDRIFEYDTIEDLFEDLSHIIKRYIDSEQILLSTLHQSKYDDDWSNDNAFVWGEIDLKEYKNGISE